MPLEVKAEDLVRMGLADKSDIECGDRRSKQKLARRLIKDKVVRSYRESTGLFLLESKTNGDCRYLDDNRRCQIYEKRPGVCRDFPTRMGLRLGHCPYIKK